MTDDSQGKLRFQEIEHKFVVEERFDLSRFGDALETLSPTRTSALRVLDRYYLVRGSRSGRFVIRHRYDPELHHLTLKTFGTDTEIRQEVNIDLGHHVGDQHDRVEAFLGRLGIEWSGSLEKDLRVWYFPDAEVVHYHAATQLRSVRCVEFEATRKRSLAEALETVRRYELATGFDSADRCRRSLLQMLFPEVAEHLDVARPR